ncbi:hypothetical protein FKB34_01755 [Glycocaulis profundi]|nr:hypothetical protein FKB34_01755 [Glycocaulis profundi]
MAVGARIRNSDKALQIDERYRNFAFRAKGSATCSTAWSSGGVTKYRTGVSFPGGIAPLCFVVPTSQNMIAQWGASVSGSTWTFELLSNVNGAAFNWFVFDVPQSTGLPPGMGMRVWRPAALGGGVAFDSRQPPLKIVSVQAAGAPAVPIPSGRVYAALQTTSGFFYTDVLVPPGPDTHRYFSRVRGVNVVGGEIVADGFFPFEDFTRSTASPLPGFTPQTPQYVIADVTHL